MNTTKDPLNPDLQVGMDISGYRVQRAVTLDEIQAFYYELEDMATGARHIHISREDSENTFGVVLKTIPSDSTGVAHILEHTVLCGSETFPVRDPFFSMLKRSLSTFMNALTASDWTMYPFSTQNRKDFYNLMDVYLDAVFFPRIEKLSFKQEGIRLEIAEDSKDTASFLSYKGVVYNEMKGAMSSPEQTLTRALMKSLYPDTTYSNNSGGDPEEIPALTHEQLLQFHRWHYHPSNAYFYSFGNLPVRDHLVFIREKVLDRFDRIDPKTEVLPQPRWQRPGSATASYPLARNEDPRKKFQFCLGWLTVDIQDAYEVLILTLLEQILLGNSASPLRKALIDCGLGTALCDNTGFYAEYRDTLFCCGLKDVNRSAGKEIEALVFDLLGQLVEKGIDIDLIESAIHQIEFQRKEITNQPYPYGLKVLLSMSGNWIHGADPLQILEFDSNLKRLREELAEGAVFEKRIERYMLNNPHRVSFTLIPDSEMEEKEIERVRLELQQVKARLSENELEAIRNDALELVRIQETIDDVSVLPTLDINDIPPSVHKISPSDRSDSQPDICYEQATSGIFYFSSAIGVGNLEEPLLPLVPFFCRSFSRVGTRLNDYTEIARKIDRYTGGVGLTVNARTPYLETSGCLPFISMNGKCLNRNREPLFEIFQELVSEFDFGDLNRLKNLLLEYGAGLEAAVVPNGHRLAILRSARNLTDSGRLNEVWNGIEQVKFIKNLSRNLSDKVLEDVAGKLNEIGRNLLCENNFRIALIGEPDIVSKVISSAKNLRLAMKGKDGDGFNAAFFSDESATGEMREGWATSSAVSFVAQTFQTVRMGHRDAPALSIIGKMLRSLYLHREIREKGGAYGGFSLYNPEDGLFSVASYRDPHILDTLKAFEGASRFVCSGDFKETDITEAILQVCSEIDKPDPPGPAARKAFFRTIVSLSDETREEFKNRLLRQKKADILSVANTYFALQQPDRGVAVISGEEKLKTANSALGEQALDLNVI